MNDIVHTAWTLDRHRAVALDRENDLLRSHAQRASSPCAPHRPSTPARVAARIKAALRGPVAAASC